MELTSYDIVLCISTGGGVDQKVSNLFRLGLKFELVVRRLVSVKSLVENFLDRITKRGHNESRYQGLVEGLLLTKSSDLGGLVVPLIDISIYVDTEDRGVCRVDQLSELVGHSRHSSIMLSSFRHILKNNK